jgi:hypothetical protein
VGDLLHILHATLQMEYFQRNSQRAKSNKKLERLVTKPRELSIISRDRGFANRKHTSTPVSQNEDPSVREMGSNNGFQETTR